MANRIKGITIEIDGNTTKLDKALQSTDAQLKKTQTSLKDVDKLLKMDPGNTELLAQKQRLLAEAVDGTRTRLETLRTAATEADEALARGSAYTAKYGQLDTELAKVSDSYKELQKQKEEMDTALSIGEISTEEYEKYTAKVQETGEQLKELRKQKKEADAEFAGSKIDQSQYDALQRELLEAERAYQSAEKAAKSFNASAAEIQAVADKVSAGAEKISSAFAPVSAAAAAIGTASVTIAADFDKQMSQVAAISGATGDELQALRDKAREMGETTKFSASEAAEAMTYMAMAGWKTEDMLSGIEGIMNLAAASGESLATTSDIVTDALTAFGLRAQDSAAFSDVLAAASSNANTNVSMMGETFKYVAPIAGALGYSVEDTAVAIGLMANSGIKASQAGTTLRTIMTSLSGVIEGTGQNIGYFAVSTTNADGSMREFGDILNNLRVYFKRLTEAERASFAESVVGTEAMSGFLALMNASQDDIAKLQTAIEGSTGASAEMAAVMQDNLFGQLEILKSQVSELAISLGETLMPAVRDIVSGLQGLLDMFNNLPDGVKSFSAGVVVLLAAIAPVAGIVSNVTKNLSSVVGWVGKISETLGGLGSAAGTAGAAVEGVTAAAGGLSGSLGSVLSAAGALFTGPVGIAAGAAVAAAGLAILWNTNEDFRNAVIGLGETIAKFFTDTLPEMAGNALKWFSELPDHVAYAVGYAVGSVIAFFRDLVTSAIEIFPKVVESVSTFFSELPGRVATFFEETIEGIRQWGQSVISWAQEAIPNLVESIGSFFDNLPEKLLEIGENMIAGLLEGIQKAWSALVESVFGLIGSFVQGIKDALGIHSPSRVFAGIGKNMALGLGEGWDDEFNAIKRSITDGMAFDAGNIALGITPQTQPIDVGEFTRSVAASANDMGSSGSGVQNITLTINGDLAALFRLFRIGIQTEDARLGPSLAKT